MHRSLTGSTRVGPHRWGRPPAGASTALLATFLAAALASTSGCVRRTLQITSVPPGATVYLDGRDLGTTPIEMPFTWYGKREILLFKPPPTPQEAADDPTLDPHAYRLSDRVTLERPIHQAPGIDIASNLLFPGTIEDRKELHFELEQLPISSGDAEGGGFDDLLLRAEGMRTRAKEGGSLGSETTGR